MNKYIRASVVVPWGIVKLVWKKIFHFNSFQASYVSMISFLTEISIDKGAKVSIGKLLKMRDGAKIRVRAGAICEIGDYVSINTNNIIACHEKIIIGNNVQLSPNVQIYDHDHDFRHIEGLKSNHFKTSEVIIGNNCWIGANTIILRGTTLGDNCIVGAGSVIKGKFPSGAVIVQKRETSYKVIEK